MSAPSIPTIPEIRDQILADIQAGLGITTPLLPKSAWRLLATALAGAVYLAYLFGRWAYAQIFTETAGEAALILRGEEYGLVRASGETLDAFRARLQARQTARPKGGSKADYVGWALEVDGVAEAFVDAPSSGVVNIYPIAEADDPADRIPDAALLAAVEAYLNEDARRPLGPATIEALAFSEIVFNVDIANISPNTAAIKATIQSAVEDYLYARRPLLFDDDPVPINMITAAQLTKVCLSAGAEIATVTLKDAGGSSITDYTLEAYELAKLGTLTWI